MRLLSLIWAITLWGFAGPSLLGETYSQLWNPKGKRWQPYDRLPDFSYAGYHNGERDLPKEPVGLNVKDFGAKGDGQTDDTQAFVDALAQAEGKVLEIPPGVYMITKILDIKRTGTVLRGAGTDQTILFFPIPLNDIQPNWGTTTGGRPTSNYSWSGGFLWFKGDFQSRELAGIEGEYARGIDTIYLSTTEGLRQGQAVEIRQQDTPENSLATYLYDNDPGDTKELKGVISTSMVIWIDELQPKRIRFHPALRFDLRKEWNPKLLAFQPTVQDAGVEHMTLRFPATDYEGHFTELGFNGIAFSGVAHCWVRDVRFENADSGIFLASKFCTLQDILFVSERKKDGQGCTGHHGITLGGTDNLLTGFDFQTRFIHDITVSIGSSHNVASSGKGVDLCFDHHKRAPYQNLFTDIDIGEGRRPWMCGGGASLGKHCAARSTWWNIRSKKPIHPPGSAFSPRTLNFVGLTTQEPTQCDPEGFWWEAISPADLIPGNLYKAQLEYRLKK